MSFIDGDGRAKLHPPPGALGRPMSITRSQARRIIAQFKSNKDYYSSSGGTFWLVKQWCDEQKVSYESEAPHTIRMK